MATSTTSNSNFFIDYDLLRGLTLQTLSPHHGASPSRTRPGLLL
jgi:hypothetical protein